jgi:hypothetical protein
MTDTNTEEYSQNVLMLIKDHEKLNQLKTQALADADVYTLDNMVEQFVQGISQCLAG